jgi:hypothetical protein
MTITKLKPMQDEAAVAPIISNYEAAKTARGNWHSLWQECYEFTLPSSGMFNGQSAKPDRKSDRLYDGTACDAVDQLAATLLSHLIPAQDDWFSFTPGAGMAAEDAAEIAPRLNAYSRIAGQHLRRSNLAVELHQCLLDLIIGGTACLLFEENPPGADSAFKFSAVPLQDAYLGDSGEGRLDTLYRTQSIEIKTLQNRYPNADIRGSDGKAELLEAIEPTANGAARVTHILLGDNAQVLQSVTVAQSPLIAMRWMKSPGEDYGRSPVMKALPDIKTANKVVELTLKNASIAVAGIWQAEDDGVLNPANISLLPGTIIPKAVGSKGLTPLEPPGKFDVSQLMLDDLRARIRHALLADRLPQGSARPMTATEVIERTADMALTMTGVYGRLQAECLYPLLHKACAVLARRGEIPAIPLGGRLIDIAIHSPLARAAGQREAQGLLRWLDAVGKAQSLDPDTVNVGAVIATLGKAMGVPPALYAQHQDQSLDAGQQNQTIETLLTN